MGKELFVNVGKNIKSLAKTIANWILGLHIVLAVVFFCVGGILLLEEIFIGYVGFLIAILLVVFGYALSRLTVMLLYAYGEITDRLISIDSKMNGTASEPKADNKREPVAPKVESKAQKMHRQELIKQGGWKCHCGKVNASYVSSCSCGVSQREIKYAHLTAEQKEE